MGASVQNQKSTAPPTTQEQAPSTNEQSDMSLFDSLPSELKGLLKKAVGRGNAFIQEVLEQNEQGQDETKCQKPFEKAASGTQTIYTPTNKPNGKTLYFFYGYTGSKKDVGMREDEDDYLTDDIYAAILQGFKVVYDTAGSKASFLKAVYDGSTSGIYWSGHGYPDGDIQGSDGNYISHTHIDSAKVGGNCQYLILATCNSGSAAAKWKKAMGSKCAFHGWVTTTTTSETIDFTSEAFLDSWSSHKGTNPDMELRDYINAAAK